MLPRKYTKGIQSVMPLYTHGYERTQLKSQVAYILYSSGNHWERLRYTNCALQACFTLLS